MNKGTNERKEQKIDITINQISAEVIKRNVILWMKEKGIKVLPGICPIVKVMTSDNQIIELSKSSTSTTDIGFKWQYSLDSEGNHVFLDKSTIKNIMINNQNISID